MSSKNIQPDIQKFLSYISETASQQKDNGIHLKSYTVFIWTFFNLFKSKSESLS